MGSSFRLVCAAALLLSTSAPAWSQSISEMIETANQQSAEVQRVLTALQTSDQLTQFKLVQAMLAHEDKALVRLGREHALFSTNPVMQNAAIVSVFNENDFVEFHLLSPDSAEALTWAEFVGGAQDGTTGRVVVGTGEFDGKCWRSNGGDCRFTIVGTSVQFYWNESSSSNDNAQAVLQLGPDGVLRGRLTSRAGGTAVEIDLKE